MRLSSADRSTVIGDERRFGLLRQHCLDHRMAALHDLEAQRAVDNAGAHNCAGSASSARAAATSIVAIASAMAENALRFGFDAVAEALEDLEFDAPARDSAAEAMRCSSVDSSLVMKRTALGNRLAVEELRAMRRRLQRCRILRRHLDEIAEHVVVADLQRS